MIVSDLEHVIGQAAHTPFLAKALDWLRTTRGQELPEGRLEIDGSNVYALVQSYRTTLLAPGDGPLFEAHRKYIDVQYVVSGAEAIGWAPVERLTVTKSYDPVNEAVLGTVSPREVTLLHLSAGQLAVLWPEDAHAPRLAVGEPSPVKKIVVKVAV
jgi:YhcH/YjgK/YiaL family protein